MTRLNFPRFYSLGPGLQSRLVAAGGFRYARADERSFDGESQTATAPAQPMIRKVNTTVSVVSGPAQIAIADETTES